MSESAFGEYKSSGAKKCKVILTPLAETDREQFIKDNQEAFNYGAMEEFGMRDDHFEEDGQIISRETIERSIDGGEAYLLSVTASPLAVS